MAAFVEETRFLSVQSRPVALSRNDSVKRLASVLDVVGSLVPALATWRDPETGRILDPPRSPPRELELASDAGVDWWGQNGADTTLHIHIGSNDSIFGSYVTLRPTPLDNWGVDIGAVLGGVAESFEAESGMFGSTTLGEFLDEPCTTEIWPAWMVFVRGTTKVPASSGYQVRRVATGWVLASDAFDFEPKTLESVKALTSVARQYVIRERSHR